MKTYPISTIVMILGLLGMAACATAETPTSNAASPASEPPSNAPLVPSDPAPLSRSQTPLVLTIQGPDEVEPGSVIEVTYAIQRRTPTDTPMQVSTTIPEGLALASGKANEQIVDDASTTITRTLAFTVHKVPREDLVVTVASTGRGYAVTAKKAYRFGRPAPSLPAPARGKPIRVEGRSLGEPIRLDGTIP